MVEFNASDPENIEQRRKLVASIFALTLETAASIWVEPPFYFAYGTHIKVGRGTYINSSCNFLDDGIVTIGERVMFGPNVNIATVGHSFNPALREYMFTEPVTIEKDCWIGMGVTICPGVTIGEGTVIGAGSVVTKDIPPKVVAVGNPCRVLREISGNDLVTYNHGRPIEEDDLEEERRLRG